MNKLVGLCGVLATLACGSNAALMDGGMPGTGGAIGTGGSGACVTGNEGCACYPNGTCNATLQCLSQLCVAGAAGRGGTTGSAGTTGVAGRGGTTGAAGVSGIGPLTFSGGVVQRNDFGIAGPVYTISDVSGSGITPTCSSDTCFRNVTGTGPICVQGTVARVLNDVTGMPEWDLYWGAGLALDLNNPSAASSGQGPYAASQRGITGFQFSFTNSVGSPVRFTYKVRDPSTGAQLEYCLDLTSASSVVVPFSSARQQCYNNPQGPALTAAMANNLLGLQWQVPTNTSAAVGFNYCFNNLKPTP